MQKTLNAMDAPIDPTILDVNMVEAFLTQLQTNIVKLGTTIQQVRAAIDNMESSKTETLASLMGHLDIEGHFATIKAFWNEAAKKVGGLRKELKSIARNIDNGLVNNTGFIRVGFYVIGGVFLIMTAIAILSSVRLLIRGVKMRLHARPSLANVGELILKTCLFKRACFYGYCFSQYADAGNTFCGKGSVCCCSFILIPILLIFAVIIAALLFAVTFVSGRCMPLLFYVIILARQKSKWWKNRKQLYLDGNVQTKTNVGISYHNFHCVCKKQPCA